MLTHKGAKRTHFTLVRRFSDKNAFLYAYIAYEAFSVPVINERLFAVIRVILGDGVNAVELFCQDNAYHGVRQGEFG